jgi:hypothetical protein
MTGLQLVGNEFRSDDNLLAPFGDGLKRHGNHEFFAVSFLNFQHVARAEIFDGDAFAEVGAIGGDARQAEQVTVIIFALAQFGQSFTRNSQNGAAQFFRGVAVVDFGETGNGAVFGRAQRFYRQRTVVETFVAFQAVDALSKQLQTDFTRHAVRAGNGGKRDGVVCNAPLPLASGGISPPD